MDQGLELVFATYPSWSHPVVRLALGVVSVAHGGRNVLGWFGGPGLKGVGVPPAAAVTAAFVELLSGWAMRVGLATAP